jgi:hypothetical protein
MKVSFDGSAFFIVEGFGYRGKLPLLKTDEENKRLAAITSAEELAAFTIEQGGEEYNPPVIRRDSVVFEPLSVELRKQIEAAEKQGGDLGRLALADWLVENSHHILSSLEGYEDS